MRARFILPVAMLLLTVSPGGLMMAAEAGRRAASRTEPPAALERNHRDSRMATRHKLTGRACYYSDFFDGRKTASGEIFRQWGHSAAHLTLPLGTWVEVESLASGRSLTLKINDRGPYTGGFAIDLSRGAARFLGVDTARDRRVIIRIVALPGETFPAPTEQSVRNAIPGEVLSLSMRSTRSFACIGGTE
ncbi:MAG TPA: septal ring lytic transglycosylase RlpA family protein [Thermoanaerobaculia bacterium]|nr:septal ring lytic transglycosylase RlpA family protein [Thermoanaerobaculia bacterium]